MYFPLVACFHLEMWSSLWWSFVGGFLVVFFCCWFCDYSLKLSYFLNFQCLCWLNIWNYMLILIYLLIFIMLRLEGSIWDSSVQHSCFHGASENRLSSIVYSQVLSISKDGVSLFFLDKLYFSITLPSW